MEFPHLQEAYKKYKDQGFEIIAVNVSARDTPEAIKKLFTDAKLTFTPVKDEIGENMRGKTMAAYGVRGCPTNFVVDKEGKIVASWVGFHPQTGAKHLKEEWAKLGFKDDSAPAEETKPDNQ